jgi:peptidoglycan pentaglycine glycine transferase (the first glycine)
MSYLSYSEWDLYLAKHPEAHVLQTSAWGSLKSGFNWKAYAVQSGSVGALVLFRKLPLGYSLAYIPKGPVGTHWSTLWPEIDRLCAQQHAFMLKVEPDAWEEDIEALQDEFTGFKPLAQPIQPRRTILIDLNGGEEQILERMKQKTRYNIRLAEKKGIKVRVSSDVKAFHDLMLTTGQRDQFGVHSLEYYRRAYDLFTQAGNCALLIAEYEGRPLAGLMVFKHGQRAFYLYGASSDEERNRMPTYLLQWEAMRWAKLRGCSGYDLWGVPDEDEAILEANFEQRSDGLWGVYRFKRGFGGALHRSVYAFERVYQPVFYRLYQWYSKRRKIEG